MDVLDAVMKWIVAPVAAFVWLIYQRQQDHATELAVLRAQAASNKEAHDREFKQLQDSFKAVFTKLDDIERALRT
jgi:uncharacterized protein HemX